jgi:hypothetical protein
MVREVALASENSLLYFARANSELPQPFSANM